ncbi:threonylcarbamoyladenosine tRNA methylthiotransferase [Zootermopsis nevadensis]|uniref:threonylcarbamoyladenosine tRNA methylthiotransferase n=1 Tax=Zootermopsis nevadensis TaxID=136037 RepID=UPI000B8E8636|nr:threonylcarbamoyladenosine tRNA methylthiotransferase [Zootermopsis nevadensis]
MIFIDMMPAACSEIVGDIEDLISSQDITPKERYSNKKSVTVRARKKQNAQVKHESEVETYTAPASIIPGTQTIYIKTWGCAHNSSDSEYMAGLLTAYGYTLTDNKLDADLWLLNSCTVKNPAEDHFRNEVEAGQRKGKAVVVAGCVPQGAPKTGFLHGLSVIGVQQIDRVVEVVEETLKGHTVRLFGQKKEGGRKTGGASLLLPKVRKNPLIEIIPINTGCLNQCTYCKTKHARGDLGSYPPDEIVFRAQQSFKEGVCELWLTSEDTGTYGRDIDTNLPELLWKLVEIIPCGCMMRVGMTNPPYILEHLEEMAKILSHPRVYSFLHIPVQSGSDAVLGDMKREYNRADFQKVVDYLRERVPGITIATDIICGFPTETEEDFQDTMSLCKQYRFPSLFINQFYPRPGTPAARMPRLPAQEVKKRTRQLSEFFQSYQPYSHKIGEVQDVLVTEVSHDRKHYVGHNKFYEQVLLPKHGELVGKMVAVKIVSCSKYSMNGEPLQKGSSRLSYDLTSPLSWGKVSGIEAAPTSHHLIP